MKTFAMTIDLKDDPENIKKYLEYHKNVWPEVRRAVKNVGMKNVRIFRLGTRMVQIFEAPDDFNPVTDVLKYAEDPIVKKWDDMMNEFQSPLANRQAGEWWAQMELVYDSNTYDNV